MKQKEVIYPRNFFEKEINLDTIVEDENDAVPHISMLDKKYSNTQNLGSYTNRMITLKTEGDKLLGQESNGLGSNYLNWNDKIEIDYGEEVYDAGLQSIESGLMTRYYHEKLITLDNALMIFAIWQIVASVIYYDTDFQDRNPKVVTYLLWLMLVCSAVQIIITYIRYKMQIELEQQQKILCGIDDLFTTHRYLYMIFEMCILILLPYPFLNEETFNTFDYVDFIYFEFKWNWLLTILGWMRIYIIMRVLLKWTNYMNPRAFRISRMYGCTADYSYAIKCLFKDYPITLSLIAFIFSVFVFGYCLFICEQPLILVIPKDGQALLFDSFQNSIWCVIITMTTIGYGDFYPRTMLGRWCTGLLTMWGTFIVSIMVVVISNALAMSNQEKRALLLLKRLQTRKILHHEAGKLLSGIVKYNNIEKSEKSKGKTLKRSYYQQKIIDLRQKTRNFRNIKRILKSMTEDDNMSEQMTREFDFIKEDVKLLSETQQKLCRQIEDSFGIEK